MANPILTQDIIDAEGVVKALDIVISKANELQGVMEGTIVEIMRDARALKKELDDAKKSGSNPIPEETVPDVDKLHKAFTSVLKDYQDIEDVVRDTLKVKKSYNDLMKAERQYVEENGQSYNNMYAQYNAIKAVMNNLNAAIPEQANLLKRLGKEAESLMNKMNTYQQATGKYTLQVGNYSKATNGLVLSMNQVTRELPSLMNSMNQFAMAISNNIPILVDQWSRYSQEQKAAQESYDNFIKQGMSHGEAIKAMGDSAQYLGGKFKALKLPFQSITGWIGILSAAFVALTKVLSNYVHINWFQGMDKKLQKIAEGTKAVFDIQSKLVNLKLDTYTRKIADAESEVARARSKASSPLVVSDKEKEVLDLREKQLDDYNKKFANVISMRGIYEKRLAKIYEEIAAAEKKRTQQQTAGVSFGKGAQKELDRLKAQASVYESMLEPARKAEQDRRKFDTDLIAWEEQRAKIMYDIRWNEIEAEAGLEERRTALMREGFAKQREELKNNIEASKRDIERQLNDPSLYLSPKQRKALQQSSKMLDMELEKGLKEIAYNEKVTGINAIYDIHDARISAEEDGYSKEYEILLSNYKRRRALIKAQLEEDVNLTKEERKVLQNEYDLMGVSFKRSTDKLNLDRLNAIAESERMIATSQRDRSKATSYEKSFGALQDQIDYWNKFRNNTIVYGNLAKDELERKLKEIDETIASLTFKQTNLEKSKTIWDRWGVDEETAYKIETIFQASIDTFNTLVDSANEYLQVLYEIAQAEVDAANAKVEATKEAYDYEREARANGYANSVEIARAEYREKLRLQKQALEKQKEIAKIQEGIDIATQVSSLITATAQIWKTYSSIPVPGLGQALAGVATAAMWGAFVASKVKARQLAETQYGDGMSEYLDYGGSHASGHDIDFGTDSKGRRRTVERGEVIGVINKRNVRKFGAKNVTGIIDSLNDGTFGQKYGNAFSDVLTVEANHTNIDLSRLERGVDALVSGNEKRVVVADGCIIEYYKNSKRIIRN